MTREDINDHLESISHLLQGICAIGKVSGGLPFDDTTVMAGLAEQAWSKVNGILHDEGELPH